MEEEISIDPEKKQIFLIDEARAVRTFVGKALAGLPEYQIVEFDSGAQGFSFLTGESDLPLPELLICESKFRDIEAASMIKRIRQNPATEKIPIIIFTTNKEKKQMITFLQAGADEYLQKPSNAEHFSAKVMSLLSNKEEFRKLDEEEDSGKAVLVVDDDPGTLDHMQGILSNAGYNVICCGNSLNALRKWRIKIGVALLDINLPDIDGISLAEAVKKRFSNARIMLSGSEINEKDIQRANNAGIQEIMKKPIPEKKLLEKIERLMQPSPPLHQLEIQKQYRARILSPMRPLPPVIEDSMSLSFSEIGGLFEKYPDLDEKKCLMVSESIWSVPEKSDVDITAKDPAVQEGRLLKKVIFDAIQNHRKEPDGAAINMYNKEVDSILIEKSYDLGLFLYEKEPLDAERLEKKLLESSFTGSILKNMDAGLKDEGLQILELIMGYLDLYFFYFEFERKNNNELLHWLSVAFLSIITGATELEKQASGLDEKERKVSLALVGFSAFLHDIGETVEAISLEREKESFYKNYPAHVDEGYDLVKKLRVFECTKQVIKDHHKDLNQWSSKFDSCTRVVQLVNDIDNYTRENGIFFHGSSVKPSPEKYSWEEACLFVLDHSRNGIYDWGMVKSFYKAINHSGFIKSLA